METDDRSSYMDQKPDIVMYINDKEIGRFSNPKVYLRDTLFTRKMVFTRGKYFGLIDKLCERPDVLETIQVVSSTGRTYSIEKFMERLEFADQIL